MDDHDDSEFDNLNCKELKDFLRDHNQFVSGNKSELIKRAKGVRKLGLVAKDCRDLEGENAVQKRKSDKLTTPHGKNLPTPKHYKNKPGVMTSNSCRHIQLFGFKNEL